MTILGTVCGGENYDNTYADKRFTAAGTVVAGNSVRGVDMVGGAITQGLAVSKSTFGVSCRVSGGIMSTTWLEFRNNTTQHMGVYTKNNTGELRLSYGESGDVGSGVLIFPAGEYHIEMYGTVGAAGSVVVRLNGKQIISVSGVDTQNGASTDIDNFRIGLSGSGFRACDIIWQDAASPIGDANVDVVFGDRVGDYTQFTSSAPDTADEVWQVDADAGPGFSNQTTGFNDATDANFTPFPATEAVGDYVAVGYAEPFTKLTLDNLNGTQGVGGIVVWEYWNGSWTALSGVSDGTSGFTAAVADGQLVTWTLPSDWVAMSLNGGASLYYVRARVTTVYSTNPVYDQGFIANNWTNVDDGVPNTTDYNASTTVTDRDSFGHAGAFALTAHTIKAVQIVVAAFKDDSGSREMEAFARVNSTDFTSGPSYPLAQLDPQYFYALYEQDQDAGPGAWTNSALNLMEMGYRLSV